MSNLGAELEPRLRELREHGLSRSLRPIQSPQGPTIQIDGHQLLNFSSNDYLGLANHERLRSAAIEAIEKFGVGSGASRLISGSLVSHHELEERLAQFKQAPAALTFSSGYATALGTICALLGKDDVIILDKLVHASIIDAARLSGAKVRVFAHNDSNDLEDILKWARARAAVPKSNVLIVTESIFSMDGDCSPLREIVELKERHGAWLLLDEAHSTGLYGPRGAGLAEQLGLSKRVDIQMGTLGKALGASGGFVCGSRQLVDYLINRARAFVFSTAPVPAASGAASEAVRIVQSIEGETLRRILWERVLELHQLLDIPPSQTPGAILPIMIGEENRTMAAATAFFQRGIYVPGIRYPSVPRGKARLRITLSASHKAEQVHWLAAELTAIAKLQTRPEKRSPIKTAK